MTSHRTISVLPFVLLVHALGCPADASADLFRRRCDVTRSCQCPACAQPRRCKAGDESGDLKIHIVGNRANTVEAFFKEEYFRIDFPLTWDLGCGSDVKLAKKNTFGTFAVRFGMYRDRFQVFGWKEGKFQPEQTSVILLERGYPVTLEWVTSRILKVRYGRRLMKEYVLRFNDADAPAGWTGLYQTDNPDAPFDPDGPDSP